MRYANTSADRATSESLTKKLRGYVAPVVATLVLGGLLVGDMALRCYPYWS